MSSIFVSRRLFFTCCISILIPLQALLPQTEKQDALKLYNDGNYEQAIHVCKEEIATDNKNIDSYVVLSWSLVKNAQYREAEYWATEGHKRIQYDHRIIEVLAEAKFYLGNNAASLALFQEYISLVYNNGSRIADAYYFMGEIYIREARFNHADIALTTAIRFDPLNDIWWARLGYAREMAKNYLEAAAAYDQALKINTSQTDALRGKERINRYL